MSLRNSQGWRYQRNFFSGQNFSTQSVEIKRTGAAESSLNPDDVVLVLQCSERLMPPTPLKCCQSGRSKMHITRKNRNGDPKALALEAPEDVNTLALNSN